MDIVAPVLTCLETQGFEDSRGPSEMIVCDHEISSMVQLWAIGFDLAQWSETAGCSRLWMDVVDCFSHYRFEAARRLCSVPAETADFEGWR